MARSKKEKASVVETTELPETETKVEIVEVESTPVAVETAVDPVDQLADAQSFEPEVEQLDEMDDEYEEEQLPPVNPDISSDPSSTVAAAILAIGRLYNDAGVIAAALTKHLREQAGQPELQGFLQRMQTTLGDTRHAIESIEQSTSEYLRDAIVKGVS